jgi:hypothetical protein
MSTDTTEGQLTCTDDMKKLHITCTEEVDTVCACCGKEGSDLNICNKCQMVKYCNAACKRKHRTKHKKKCERRAAEIKAELHEEQLFKQPPPPEDCPICFLRLPTLASGSVYMACCGKVIDDKGSNVTDAPTKDRGNIISERKCPFCRTQAPPSEKEMIKRLQKRMEADDANASNQLGCCYRDGHCGLPRDFGKAFEIFNQAVELGSNEAYNSIGYAYRNGSGVERDEEKAKHYYELAAMRGNVTARFNLGNNEMRGGNMERALKHYIIAAGCGESDSLKEIHYLHLSGHATKEDYTQALRAYQAYLCEIKSAQRDKVADDGDDRYKYY